MACLRELLDGNKERFRRGGIADIQVDETDLLEKASGIHRALVAHAALNERLKVENLQPQDTLSRAIRECISLGKTLREPILNRTEARCLRNFNQRANEAKHAVA